MTAIALVRYVASDSVRAERWVAPCVLFLIITVSGTAAGGTALGGYGFTVTALFPVATWVAVTVLNSEDPIQTAITTASVGSSLLVRLAKMTVAFLACQVLSTFALVYPLVTGHPASAGDVAAGAVGHLLSSLAGVTVGSLISRPVLRTPAWAVITGIVAFLVEILVPGFPPVRPLAVAFSDSPSPTWSASMLGLVAAETLAGSAVLIWLAHAISRRRT